MTHRLLDTVKAKLAEQVYAPALDQAVLVVIDNVAQYVFENHKYKPGDLEGLALNPPLRTMFMEFKLNNTVGRVGWLFTTYEVDDPKMRDLRLAPTMHLDQDHLGDMKWGVRGLAYFESIPQFPQLILQMYLDSRGAIMPIPDYPDYKLNDQITEYPNVPYVVRPTKDSVFEAEFDHDPYGQWLKSPLVIMNTCLWGIAFMNAKNVSLEPMEPTKSERKRHRKQHRTEPIEKYYMLAIHPMRKSTADEQGGSHASPSFHIRRGSWATYTDAAPLFGKYVGQFWRPQSTPGKKSQGTVTKGYDVNASNGDLE